LAARFTARFAGRFEATRFAAIFFFATGFFFALAMTSPSLFYLNRPNHFEQTDHEEMRAVC
jgi:hypothetical protein